MNFRTTIILFVLVIAGLIFFIVANRGGAPAEQASEDAETTDLQQGRKLLEVKPEDVKRLVIKPADGPPLELVKSEGAATSPGAPGGDWKLVQPAQWNADSFDARNVVESVANLKSRGRPVSDVGRSQVGLDKPRYTIELTAKDGKVTTLHVGNEMALGNDVYLDPGDGKVRMVAFGD
ncbi:MAG TPA: DUF4340 domain-containing protein, partial [Tepidisphaeraceae bacterium]|nr:DUF4340 domain-containing protein [Tepidisphaeraceae bacterium]